LGVSLKPEAPNEEADRIPQAECYFLSCFVLDRIDTVEAGLISVATNLVYYIFYILILDIIDKLVRPSLKKAREDENYLLFVSWGDALVTSIGTLPRNK
jgi:hypothetical protein